MSIKQPTKSLHEMISDEQVIEYLQQNSHFFEKHVDILSYLKIPHPCGTGVISLIEKQVLYLREQNRQIRRKLLDMVQIARENDQLNDRIHNLAMSILNAETLAITIEQTIEVLKKEFRLNTVIFHLSLASSLKKHNEKIEKAKLKKTIKDARETKESIKSSVGNITASPSIQWHADLESLQGNLLITLEHPFCGYLPLEDRKRILGNEAESVQSLAILLLQDHSHMDKALGLLILGSDEPDRFLPTMGTIFLTHIAQLVGAGLCRFLDHEQREEAHVESPA